MHIRTYSTLNLLYSQNKQCLKPSFMICIQCETKSYKNGILKVYSHEYSPVFAFMICMLNFERSIPL